MSKIRIKQHQTVLPVVNLDCLDDKYEFEKKRKHGDLFPNSCRFIFAGPSGCGKSNALMSLIFDLNGLNFENVYIYSKSLYQPKYQILEQILHEVPGVNYFPFKENAEIAEPNDVETNSIFIFDDVIGENQDKIKSYYAMGRHKSIDVAFLCQTYVAIKKHIIRDNTNILVIFKQDDVNLKHIFDEHVSPDMTYDEFKKVCGLCWNNNFGFLVIVKDFDLNNGRYRMGFDKYIVLDDN